MGTQVDTRTSTASSAAATTAAATAATTAASSLMDPLQDPLATDGDTPAEARTAEGTELGKRSWDDALGSFLGGHAYDALAPHLTKSSLTGYADQAWGAAVEQLRALVAEQPAITERGLADELDKALSEHLEDAAGQWLGENGRAEALAGWVDGNPYWVALAALAGAVTFVATNQPLPDVSIPVDVGGFEVDADLSFPGGTLDLIESLELTLEDLQTKYIWSGGEVSYGRTEDTEAGTVTHTGGARVQVEDTFTNADGEEQSFTRFGAEGNGSATLTDGEVSKYAAGGNMLMAFGEEGDRTLKASYDRTGERTDAGMSTTDDASLAYRGTSTDADLAYTRTHDATEGTTTHEGSADLTTRATGEDAEGEEVTFDRFTGTLDGSATQNKQGRFDAYDLGVNTSLRLGETGSHLLEGSYRRTGERGAGGMTTTDAATLGYTGAGFDLDLSGQRLQTPKGTGTRLGFQGAFERDAFTANGSLAYENKPSGASTTTGRAEFGYNTDALTLRGFGEGSSDGTWQAGAGLDANLLDERLLMNADVSTGRGRTDMGQMFNKTTGSLGVTYRNRSGNFETGLEGSMDVGGPDNQRNTQLGAFARWRF